MNGYHVKKPGVLIARIETEMCTQNHHEILKAAVSCTGGIGGSATQGIDLVVVCLGGGCRFGWEWKSLFTEARVTPSPEGID